jgi:hypothetical protein
MSRYPNLAVKAKLFLAARVSATTVECLGECSVECLWVMASAMTLSDLNQFGFSRCWAG